MKRLAQVALALFFGIAFAAIAAAETGTTTGANPTATSAATNPPAHNGAVDRPPTSADATDTTAASVASPDDATARTLPRTASPLPTLLLVGAMAACGAAALCHNRRRA